MLGSKPGETNPLLPQNDPSPEIQEYGTSRSKGSSEVNYYETPTYDDEREQEHGYNTNDDGGETNTNTYTSAESTRSSAWGTIVTALTFGVLFVIIFFAFNLGGSTSQPLPIHTPGGRHNYTRNSTLDRRVDRILRTTPLIDGHNDLAISLRMFYKNNIHSPDFRMHFEDGGMKGQVDLPRLRWGKVGGAFWSAFVVCPEDAGTDFSDAEYGTAVSHTLQQIDLIKRLQWLYEGTFTVAGTSLEEMLTKFNKTGAMLGPISIEGLHQVPQSSPMSALRLYYQLGVRAATLTWNCHNAFADAALISRNGTTKIAPYHRGGLTDVGRDVIREMNRLGMLIDISHTSYWTQKAVMSDRTSRAPVIYSHSSAFSICPHPRNVKDDILDLVKQTNSVVMINFTPSFVACIPGENEDDLPVDVPENATIHQVVRHIMYVGEKIGYDHVGLGSDFDGMEAGPKGLEDVSRFPELLKELLKKGISDAVAAKIAGGNVLRVWREVEDTARRMKREGQREGEDDYSGW